jgi:glycosyltransferase involved in cell wall biosynthesis
MARFLAPDSQLQVMLHGELNHIHDQQSRDPLARMLSLRGALRWTDPARMHFLVLEESIRAALSRHRPDYALATEVLPHPVPILSAACPAVPLDPPLHIGLVGQATREKGIGTFLDVARRTKPVFGEAIRFHHIGRMPPDVPETELSVLDSPSSALMIPTAEFNARIAALHYVFLPLERSYYTLSASGAILDALARGKPIITSDLPLTRGYFDQYGDIGLHFTNPNDAVDLIRSAIRSLSDGTYRARLRAVGATAEARGIAASSEVYRGILMRRAPWLAAPNSGISGNA